VKPGSSLRPRLVAALALACLLASAAPAFEIEAVPDGATPPAQAAAPVEKVWSLPLGLAVPRPLALKHWHLEVRDADGRLLQHLEGRGPLPARLTFKRHPLRSDRHYFYALSARTAGGAAYLRSGELGGGRARALPASKVAVRRGDTLWSVAERPDVYGDPFLYFLLYDANRGTLKRLDALRPGQVLAVPRRVSQARKADAIRRALSR
jgi:nucleoid-associated protein YgaU